MLLGLLGGTSRCVPKLLCCTSQLLGHLGLVLQFRHGIGIGCRETAVRRVSCEGLLLVQRHFPLSDEPPLQQILLHHLVLLRDHLLHIPLCRDEAARQPL